jgi:hypothetical protein
MFGSIFKGKDKKTRLQGILSESYQLNGRTDCLEFAEEVLRILMGKP